MRQATCGDWRVPSTATRLEVGALLGCFLLGLILGAAGGAVAAYHLLVRLPGASDSAEASVVRGGAQRARARPRLQAYVHE